MTVTFRTIVLDVPASPSGLSPRRFLVDHWCNECRQKVDHDLLVEHARTHGAVTDRQGGDAIE